MTTNPTLIYLHGFNSSPNSEKGQLLLSHLERLGLASYFHAPLLPPDPQLALQRVEAIMKQHKAPQTVTLIGSSLGGFYATYFAERYGLKAVLVNPAIYPWRYLDAYIGTYLEPFTQVSYEITLADGHFLKSLSVSKLTYPKNILLLLQTGDEIFNYQEALAKFPDAVHDIQEGGCHHYDNFEAVIPLILKFAGFEQFSS